MSITINSTKDYGEFALYEDNRIITQRSIDKMVSTLTKKNLLSCFPIVVFRKSKGIKFITDGQRRFLAAKQMGLPIFYIVNNSCTKEDIPRINSGNANWKLDDYLHSFCVKSKHNQTGAFNDYTRLQEFIQTYNFSIANSICLLFGYESQNVIADFKEGDFKITDYHMACKAAERIHEMKPYHDNWSRKYFVRAMTKLSKSPNYDHEHMMKKLREKHESLLLWSSCNSYLVNLQKIYNHNKRNKVVFIED